MICPLQPITLAKGGGYHYTSCKQEECAVWDKHAGQCPIISLVDELKVIRSALVDMRNNMPSWRDIKK